MGRSSGASGRRKRKNQSAKQAGLRHALSRYNVQDLWALLVAAGASPSVRHRWVRVGMLATEMVALDHVGGKPIGAGQLQELFDACLPDPSGHAMLEDFLPEDPRDQVRVRVGDRLFRLGPGEVERPVADVERALLVAGAIDDVLEAPRGFGVLHVLEVLLGYQDAAIEVLAGSWTADEPDFEGHAALSDGEVEAARRLVELGTPDGVAPTDAHRKALEWLTCDAPSLRYEAHHPQSSVGRFMRVRRAGEAEPRWLPLFLLPAVLGYAVAELAGEVATVADARRRFAEVVAAEVRRCLWRFDSVIGPPDVGGAPCVTPKDVVQWVLSRTSRRSLLVQVASALRADMLDLPDVPEALRAAALVAADGDEVVRVRMAVGELGIHPGAEVVPLLVVAMPAYIGAPRQPGLPGLSLDDLRWIAASAESKADLFSYCRDMARPDLPTYMGWEGIDSWEWWRSNSKSFFSGGLSPSFMAVAAHGGTAEWRWWAQNSDLEVALAILGLPPLRETLTAPTVRDDGPRSVVTFASGGHDAKGRLGGHPRPDLIAWSVHLGSVPVATTALRPEWEDHHVNFLSNLATGFGFAFGRVAETWVESHEGFGVGGYVVGLSVGKATSGVLSVTSVVRGGPSPIRGGDVVAVELALDVDALGGVSDATAVFHEAMATAIGAFVAAAGIDTGKAEAVAARIRATSPTFAASVERPLTVRNELFSPVGMDDALLSMVDRKVAEAVRAAGVEPGDYAGEDAKLLDRDVLAPAALTLLESTLAGHAMDDVMLFGVSQMERCLAWNHRAVREVQQSAAAMDLAWDPVARYQELEAEYITLRRCIEAALEVALRSAPSGSLPVDEVAWGEILAAGRGYLDATMRSEAIHHQVNPTVLRVSSSFELSTAPDKSGMSDAASAGRGRLYDFDAQAFSRIRTLDALAGESPVDTDLAGDGQVVDSVIDEAMLKGFGASATDVFTVLSALAGWPLAEDDPDAVAIEIDAAVEHVLEVSELGHVDRGRERARAALGMLTSSTAQLLAADWKPWHARSRMRRILIQPLPLLTDGRIVVSPRLCLTTASIYLRYLVQGQLPWSQPAPPGVVVKALDEFRDRRNKALESEVATLLRSEGWSVIANVKETDPERLNVPHLQTEIDVVAGRAGDPTIWLLEVKDPVEVFALTDIRRTLDRFFVDEDKKPAYAAQLQRKVNDLAPHAAHVAAALALPPQYPDAPYVVEPLFVTRQPTAAQFVSSPFPFTSAGRLLNHLGRA